MLLWLVFFALFLLCAGISIIFLAYIGVLWYASFAAPPSDSHSSPPGKAAGKGLSPSELEMLPGVLECGGGIAEGKECAVCLDGIEQGQPARIMPDCGHLFHRLCADAWLSANAACPLCRTRLLPPVPVALQADHSAFPPPPPEVDAV